MRNVITLLLLTLCVGIGYSQVSKVKAVAHKGVTNAERASLDTSGFYPVIYNTDNGQFERWNGSSWEAWGGAGGGGDVASVNGLTGTVSLDLSRSGNILSLTGDGTTVDLSGYLDNTDDQALSLNANVLSLEDGGSVSLAPYLDNTDSQTAVQVASDPFGNIAAGNVQDAINELENEKLDKTGGQISGSVALLSGSFRINDNLLTTPTDWYLRANGDKFIIGAETSSGSNSFNDTYTLSPNGIPTDPTDLVDKAYADAIGGGSGLADGDKGDITVASSGTVWTIDSGAIDGSNLADGDLGDVSVSSGSISLDSNTVASSEVVDGSITEADLNASTNASLDLADSSVQPGDNISGLTNDAGYITSQTDDQTAAEVSVADAGGNYTASDVEGVLAEIAPLLAGGTDDQTAAEVSYDSIASGLDANNVQDALDINAAANVSTTPVELTLDRTLTSTDIWRTLYYGGSDTLSVQIPLSFGSIGDRIFLLSTGSGSIKPTAASGVTFNNVKTNTTGFSQMTLYKYGTNSWAVLNPELYTAYNANPATVLPTFGGVAASIANGANSLAVDMPATVNTDDFLLVQISILLENVTITPPVGWTEIYQAGAAGGSVGVFYKIAAGTEGGGTETFTHSGVGTDIIYAASSVFDGVNTSTPYEDLTTTTLQTLNPNWPTGELISTGDNRLAVATFTFIGDRPASDFPPSYTQRAANTTSDGSDASNYLYTLGVPSASTTASENLVLLNSETGAVVSFLLIPE